jgi:subtilisin family serine protease
MPSPPQQLAEAFDTQTQSARWEATPVAGVVNGVAPRCKLVSMKVLDDNKRGKVSNILRALEAIQITNQHRPQPLIHGANLSLGHSFDPKWFACGHSPLCTAVNRLVKSGVVVVVAAGNSGYDTRVTAAGRSVNENLDISINDPGNAELAITVGSTHRDMPRTYGVSYFSSRGPTADGRIKPDLLAPGERIVSCASSGKAAELLARVSGSPATAEQVLYFEDSGTSMAAPHVSGAIAAFLSVRQEFIGQPEKIKEIFLNTAVDLQRVPHFQGRGLLDLMKALMAV